MLVLATFLSIGTVAVAFLFRFLFALESDVRSRGQHSVRVDRIHTYRVPARTSVRGSAPALSLVRFNSRLAASSARSEAPAARLRPTQNSYVKEA
jgi:hypothetical protein